MHTLLAVDDGLTNANYDAADWAFLVGLILAGLAAVAYAVPAKTTDPPRYAYARWAPALVAAAVALVAFGLLLL